MHELKGIKFHMDASVESAEPSASDSSKVGAIKLKDGKTIPADVVIMAVGIGPATEFLKESGFHLEKDGSLRVDKWLRVAGLPDVYATGGFLFPTSGLKFTAGDIATFPYVQQSNKLLRIEHWDVAINHGRSVANHIVKGDIFEGTPNPSQSHQFQSLILLGYTSTTYFWSAQGSQLRYAGTTAIEGFDDVIIQGSTDPKQPKFSAFYVKDNKVIAVMGMGTDPTVSLSAELLYGTLLSNILFHPLFPADFVNL
jgi:NADH dehydrogenase FAD-containing subunit